MPLDAEISVGYLRAEFSRASRHRIILLFVQLAVAIPPAIAVMIPDALEGYLYALAITGAALVVIWWIINNRYLRFRDAAHLARRSALLLGGLGGPFSPSEIQEMRSRLTVSESEARSAVDSEYYATELSPGPARLGEMLEESAFYSGALHEVSANIMLGILLTFLLTLIGVSLFVIPQVSHDTALAVIRIFLALLSFAMSADVLGAYISHQSAAEKIRNIGHRLIAADLAKYPNVDTFLIFTDYNNAVESAPEVIPWIYDFYRTDLNRRWAEYKSDRNERRKKTGAVT